MGALAAILFGGLLVFLLLLHPGAPTIIYQQRQVLREMRLVLRENVERINAKTQDEVMKWEEFEEFYKTLENFEYPHKDKLLEFIKYFFLDHVEEAGMLKMNY